MNGSDDSRIYSEIAMEIEQGRFDAALMTQAIAESKGDKLAAHSVYIRLRADQLRGPQEHSRNKEIESPQSTKPPDRLLGSFTAKERTLFSILFGAAYLIVVTERSLNVSRGAFKIKITATTETHGLVLSRSSLGDPFVRIIDTKGGQLELQLTDEEYKLLSHWKNSNGLP